MKWILPICLSAYLAVFTVGEKDADSNLDISKLQSDSEVSIDLQAREAKGCNHGECDPAKGDCQCCGQDYYCGCFWDITWLGGCKCRTGTRVTCWDKKDCPNRSSWTNKPFKPSDCNVGTWG